MSKIAELEAAVAAARASFHDAWDSKLRSHDEWDLYLSDIHLAECGRQLETAEEALRAARAAATAAARAAAHAAGSEGSDE